jgi:lysozyme family protein
LLFSSVDALCGICGLNEKSKVALQTMKSLFITPEHINDTPQTAPSKRILSIHPTYEKINDGVQIAKDIGIAKLRQECLHFNTWLEKLEALTDS